MKIKEYIWYCPTDTCRQAGTILFRTELPALGKGHIRCPRCRQIFNFHDVMKANKKNIESCLKRLLK